MNQKRATGLLMAALLLVGFAAVHAKAVNLSGTWVGKAVTPNGDDQVTLVLKKVKKTYTGTVTDTFGLASNSEISNVLFKDGVLTADFMISQQGATQPIHVSVKVSGDKMAGEWKDDQGGSGALELEKQKPVKPAK